MCIGLALASPLDGIKEGKECGYCCDENNGKAYHIGHNARDTTYVCKECAIEQVVPMFQLAMKNELELPPSESPQHDLLNTSLGLGWS